MSPALAGSAGMEHAMSFWDIIWFIFISFAFIAYLMVMFSIIADLFRDDSVSGGMKAVWVVLLILFPLITSLVYLISRGSGMHDRQVRDYQAARQRQDDYVRSVAGQSGPADQISRAKELLDGGTISQEEFDQLKAKALASA